MFLNRSPVGNFGGAVGGASLAEPRQEVFPEFSPVLLCRAVGISGWSFFIALNISAKQARKLRQKLHPKLRQKLHPRWDPSKMETSPKTSLCRNPLLTVRTALLEYVFRGVHAELLCIEAQGKSLHLSLTQTDETRMGERAKTTEQEEQPNSDPHPHKIYWIPICSAFSQERGGGFGFGFRFGFVFFCLGRVRVRVQSGFLVPKKLSERFWNSPWEWGWNPPCPIIQGIWAFPELSPPQHGRGRLFFRIGSGEGLSELLTWNS